ncbi:TonB-dependent receptor [bacterium]|nr:TonB-dependent receptor [bacterium]
MKDTRGLVATSLIFCLCAFASLKAQGSNTLDGRSVTTNRITGIVLDESTGRPLGNANVSLQGTNRGSATDRDGRFEIPNVSPSQYTIVVSMIGFKTIKQTVVLSQGETLDLRFSLEVQPLTFDEIIVERTSLVGNKDRLFKIPGSAHYLDAQDLEDFEYNDIHRALAEVPGINIQEEDGYGLRPNIGFRGTGSERSSKITVMEDGILQAPAPYSAPAAYYFPTVGRMSGIEVRKGSSQIKYGPFTTGGALNLIATGIPNQFDGYVEILAGEDEHRRIHATAGNSFKNFGFVAETFQTKVDGFKELDGGGDTGFDKKDYLLKFRFNTNPDAKVYQQVSFKFTQTDETSDETYLGLTDADFARNHLRRYASSQNDVMNTEQTQFVARHFIKPSRSLDFTTSFYRTDFMRNWYKLDRIRATEDGSRARIADVLADPSTFAAEYNIATGQSSPSDNALEVKANNREYYAWGLKTQAGLQFNAFDQSHDVEFGVGYHEDQIDRFQWVDLFRMDSGVMELTQTGIPGTESNRVSEAQVWTGYAEINLNLGKLTAVPGIRYENIKLTRDDFGKEDPDRTGMNLSSRENTVDILIPGIGLDYRFSPTVSAFFGVHKGFAPPGSRDGTEPEESINYELGTRVNRSGFSLQGVIFLNDYSNLLGSDLVATGGEGTGDQFNGGDVDTKGLELSVGYDFASRSRQTKLSIPFRVAYTFTDTEFKNSFESEFEPWGEVSEGDELPYVPKHQVFASIGLQGKRYGVTLGAKYNDRMRTVAGQGDFIDALSSDAHLVFDIAADFAVTNANKFFVTVQNLFDEKYIAARRPAGARPGLPRTFLAGVKTNF